VYSPRALPTPTQHPLNTDPTPIQTAYKVIVGRVSDRRKVGVEWVLSGKKVLAATTLSFVTGRFPAILLL